jgi:hypothetical protein
VLPFFGLKLGAKMQSFCAVLGILLFRNEINWAKVRQLLRVEMSPQCPDDHQASLFNCFAARTSYLTRRVTDNAPILDQVPAGDD